MAGMDWFRWHHGSVTDPKFQLIARKSGASLPDVLAVWAYILEQASQASERGSFGEIDAEALDTLFGFPSTETRTADILKAMDDRGLTKENRIVSWEKRQPKREREDNTNASRQRTFKAKQNQVTPSNATVTPDNTKKSLEESREEKIPSTSHTSGTQAPGVGVDNSKPVGTPAGLICKALKQAGMQAVSPQHPELLALIERGVTQEIFVQAAATAVSKGKDFAYMLGIVKRQLASAGEIGQLPSAAQAAIDPDSRAAIEAEGQAKGIGKWDETKEQWHAYKARVRGNLAPAVDPGVMAMVSGAIKRSGVAA